MVSGNILRIGVLNSGNHQGTFNCSVTGSGLSVSGTLDLTVTGEKKYSVYLQVMSIVCYYHCCAILYWLYVACHSAIHHNTCIDCIVPVITENEPYI